MVILVECNIIFKNFNPSNILFFAAQCFAKSINLLLNHYNYTHINDTKKTKKKIKKKKTTNKTK